MSLYRLVFILLSDIALCHSGSHATTVLSQSDLNRRLRGGGDPHTNTDTGNDLADFLHTRANVYVDRFSTCFACHVALSSNVANINLYDASSLAALLSAITLVMDEPEASIVYDRDPSRVCSFSGDNMIASHSQGDT